MRSIFQSTSLLALAVATCITLTSLSAQAEVVANCENMKNSMTEIDSRDLEKCHDIEAQKGVLFLGQGSSTSPWTSCMTASSMSAATGLNSCRDYAVKSGLNPRGCTLIANFKTVDRLDCQFNSYYYLKSAESAFIAFTLDRTTQMRLFGEAEKRSISVRELIAEKLQK